MSETPQPSRCASRGFPCPARHGSAVALPPTGVERAAILVLRFIAAAHETGDACCWEAAFERAEADFGERRGPLIVGTAAALVRRLRRIGADVDFLPPPCRSLSTGEASLLETVRMTAAEASGTPFDPVRHDVAAFARYLAVPSAIRHAA